MKNYIHHILIKHFSGTANAEEEKVVAQWLLNPDNRREYQKYKQVWEITGKISWFDEDKAWNKFRTTVVKDKAGIRFIEKAYQSPLMKMAAILVVIIATGILFYYLLQSGNLVETAQYEYATTEAAMEKEILLPDGSKVWLNQNSRLSMAEAFGESKRRVKLEGEAYFEVAKNAEKPFIIETSRSFTTILGTTFNVRAYGDEAREIISMLTGKVEFAPKASSDPVQVESGKEAILTSKGEVFLTTYENQNFLAWKTHQLVFNDNYLHAVIKDVERYFNIAIQFESQDLKNCRFTGTFANPTLNDILETLSFTLELEIQQEKENLRISGKGC